MSQSFNITTDMDWMMPEQWQENTDAHMEGTMWQVFEQEQGQESLVSTSFLNDLVQGSEPLFPQLESETKERNALLFEGAIPLFDGEFQENGYDTMDTTEQVPYFDPIFPDQYISTGYEAMDLDTQEGSPELTMGESEDDEISGPKLQSPLASPDITMDDEEIPTLWLHTAPSEHTAQPTQTAHPASPIQPAETARKARKVQKAQKARTKQPKTKLVRTTLPEDWRLAMEARRKNKQVRGTQCDPIIV